MVEVLRGAEKWPPWRGRLRRREAEEEALRAMEAEEEEAEEVL